MNKLSIKTLTTILKGRFSKYDVIMIGGHYYYTAMIKKLLTEVRVLKTNYAFIYNEGHVTLNYGTGQIRVKPTTDEKAKRVMVYLPQLGEL